MKFYSRESHSQEYYVWEYYSHKYVCLTIVISEEKKLKKIQLKYKSKKRKCGIMKWEYVVVENNFHSHGNPIYPPFSMGIWSTSIVSTLHSWECFYQTCTQHGNVIFPSPHSRESCSIPWNKASQVIYWFRSIHNTLSYCSIFYLCLATSGSFFLADHSRVPLLYLSI